MRLLNTATFKLREFLTDFPPYAILSHTWGDEEVSYQEIDLPERENKRGFAKIFECCRLALGDGLDWAWIDTCCIDKTSSAELSEAINSMFAWYRDAYVCYVYLEDVPNPDPGFPEKEFYAARWFSRGWCLQELICISVCRVLHDWLAGDWNQAQTARQDSRDYGNSPAGASGRGGRPGSVQHGAKALVGVDAGNDKS